MVDLLLGPMLRHVGESEATIWVETSAPCEVEVRAGGTSGRERTFHVGGHHYALVVLTGLGPASSTEYHVLLEGRPVWPPSGSPYPPSRIRTIDPSRPIRLVFGSCREAPYSGGLRHRDDRADVLDAFATRMLAQPQDRWPELMLFVGDQVYADYTSAAMQAFIKSRRDIRKPPKAEVADFEEYTRLYLETWSEPKMRWLLSTMPTSMIFDDHDVRDDWNTSHAWRLDMQKQPWWDRRITGALMSYWIYQHLGNLSPAGLESNDTYQAIRTVADGEAMLRDFARAADREADGAKGAMWSYRRDFGSVRLLVIDSRCGRILGDRRRSMISDAEFEWVEQQTEDGSYDHLVVVTSMPWLLPRALHGIESWNEALAGGSRGRVMGRIAEWIRRLVDLEHWAAVRESFDRLAIVFGQVGRGERAKPPPATIVVLSGDVHHTYVSEADYPLALSTRVFQITCSPIQNTIPTPMRVVFNLSWSHTVERVVSLLDRFTRVPPLPIAWHHPSGPHFGNMLASLTFDGRHAGVQLERAEPKDVHASLTDPTNVDLAVVDEVVLAEAGVPPPP
jgi:hypothetical protein